MTVKTELIRNLITSTSIELDDAEDLTKGFSPELAKLKLAKAEKVLNILKMVACNHIDGHTTGVCWIRDYDRSTGKKIHSYKEVTKRCFKCKLVFYRKRYNLMKKKK